MLYDRDRHKTCHLYRRLTNYSAHLFSAVSKPRMGHRHAGSQEPNQSDADGEPEQKDHRQRGTEAPVDLRK